MHWQSKKCVTLDIWGSRKTHDHAGGCLGGRPAGFFGGRGYEKMVRLLGLSSDLVQGAPEAYPKAAKDGGHGAQSWDMQELYRMAV